MKQSRIDALKKAHAAFSKAEIDLIVARETLKVMQAAIRMDCDHVFEDGTPNTGLFCMICGGSMSGWETA